MSAKLIKKTKKSNFYKDIVGATNKILKSGNFDPYNAANSYSRGLKNPRVIEKFEVYWNELLKDNLNNDYSRNSIPKFSGRWFDLKRENGSIWEVAEFGHEKSSRGFLNNLSGEPNNQGLVNKLFLDYVKNYMHPNRPKSLKLTSYAYLYFSLEDIGNKKEEREVIRLFNFIIDLFPIGHKHYRRNVYKKNQIVGKILILDGLKSFNEIKKVYKANKNILIDYVKPIEGDWYKDYHLSK